MDEQMLLHTPLSPTGSLLRGWRPSLAVLFHQFRGSSDRDYLLKEDFQEVFLDASQLDIAFEELDKDRDGRITLDEFMSGFATFLRQAQTSSALNKDSFLSIDPSMQEFIKRGGSSRRSVRKRPVPEIFFETVDNTHDDNPSPSIKKPTDSFKGSLKPLATRTQESIEQLWVRLNGSNPELIGDFEEFICEVSSEVDCAQRALKKQREANTKEAHELDEEMVRIQHDTLSQLEQETAILREKAQSNQSKLEVQLMEKDQELYEIKGKLQLLESEVLASKQNQNELQQKCETAFEEKDDLLQRLDQSESLLKESQAAISQLKKERDEKEVKLIEEKENKEANIAQIESVYSKEIRDLKDMLSSVVQQQEIQQHQQEQLESRLKLPLATSTPDKIKPDLLSTHHHNIGRESPSLLDEIVEKEGDRSPVLRDTMLHVKPTLGLQLNYRELDHLDLATTPNGTSTGVLPISDQSNVYLRPNRGAGRRARPTSLYGARDGRSLDLEWPPGNWRVPSQDWLEAVASSKPIIVNDSPSPTEEQIPPVPHTTPNTVSLEELKRDEHIQQPTKKKRPSYKDPEMCKPLEFVERLVVQPDVTFKILIVGNPHVGKSCFLTRLCTNTFTTRYASTIGVDFYSRALNLENITVSLQFWDTAGQERFQSVTRAYYRGADGVILMYDVTSEESFIAVKTWINSMQDNMDKLPSCILLVGNKVDLEEYGKREVLPETGETFAKIYEAQFIESSAKCGYNVSNACMTLINTLISQTDLTSETTLHSNSTTSKISISDNDKKPSCSC